MDRVLVTDVDDTLTGDDEALATLFERLETTDAKVGFGIATGRTLEGSARADGRARGPGARCSHHRRRHRASLRHTATCRTAPGSGRFATAGTETRWTASWARFRACTRVPESEHEVPPCAIDWNRAMRPTLREIRRRARQEGLRVTTILDHAGLPRRDSSSRLARPRDSLLLLQVEPRTAASAGRRRFRERLGHAFRRHLGRRREQSHT